MMTPEMRAELVYDISDAQHDFVRATTELQNEIQALDAIMARGEALGVKLRESVAALQRVADMQAKAHDRA
jgi:hypothetical protein